MPPHRAPLGLWPPEAGGRPVALSAARGSRAGERLPKKERGCAPLPPYSARDSCRRIPRSNRSLISVPLIPEPTVSTIKTPPDVPAYGRHCRSLDKPLSRRPIRDSASCGLSSSSNAWRSCFARLPIPGRYWRISSDTWTTFRKERPCIGRLSKSFHLPRKTARLRRAALPPRARKPATYLLGVRKPAGLLFGASGERAPPLSECRFLVPSVRVHLSYMPFNPAAMHSHQPRYPALAPVRGHCGSVCCRPRELRRHLHRSAFAASDALAHPRRGTRRKTRLVFALHPALPGSGQGCPAFRPGRPPHSRRVAA